jgi:hypothetical protein
MKQYIRNKCRGMGVKTLHYLISGMFLVNDNKLGLKISQYNSCNKEKTPKNKSKIKEIGRDIDENDSGGKRCAYNMDSFHSKHSHDPKLILLNNSYFNNLLTATIVAFSRFITCGISLM